MRELCAWWKLPRFKHAFIGSMGKVVEELTWMLWPLYLFLLLGSEQKVGYFSTIVLILSLTIAYFMGWYLGKHKGKRMFMISGTVISVLWIVRTFLVSIWAFIVVDVLDTLVTTIYTPVFDSFMLRFARRNIGFRFFVYREFLLGCVQVVFWLFLIALFMVPFAWKLLFLLGGAGIIVSMQMSKVLDEQ